MGTRYTNQGMDDNYPQYRDRYTVSELGDNKVKLTPITGTIGNKNAKPMSGPNIQRLEKAVEEIDNDLDFTKGLAEKVEGDLTQETSDRITGDNTLNSLVEATNVRIDDLTVGITTRTLEMIGFDDAYILGKSEDEVDAYICSLMETLTEGKTNGIVLSDFINRDRYPNYLDYIKGLTGIEREYIVSTMVFSENVYCPREIVFTPDGDMVDRFEYIGNNWTTDRVRPVKLETGPINAKGDITVNGNKLNVVTHPATESQRTLELYNGTWYMFTGQPPVDLNTNMGIYTIDDFSELTFVFQKFDPDSGLPTGTMFDTYTTTNYIGVTEDGFFRQHAKMLPYGDSTGQYVTKAWNLDADGVLYPRTATTEPGRRRALTSVIGIIRDSRYRGPADGVSGVTSVNGHKGDHGVITSVNGKTGDRGFVDSINGKSGDVILTAEDIEAYAFLDNGKPNSAGYIADFKDLSYGPGVYYADKETLNKYYSNGQSVFITDSYETDPDGTEQKFRTWFVVTRYSDILVRSYYFETEYWSPWRAMVTTKTLTQGYYDKEYVDRLENWVKDGIDTNYKYILGLESKVGTVAPAVIKEDSSKSEIRRLNKLVHDLEAENAQQTLDVMSLLSEMSELTDRIKALEEK